MGRGAYSPHGTGREGAPYHACRTPDHHRTPVGVGSNGFYDPLANSLRKLPDCDFDQVYIPREPPKPAALPQGDRTAQLGGSAPRFKPKPTPRSNTRDPVAARLRAAYGKYSCFAQSVPAFRSREFVKIIKEVGLMSETFNIMPPNRVDHVYTRACLRGPGGFKGNKSMSLAQFAYATRGIAEETGRPLAEVVGMLEEAVPELSHERERALDKTPVYERHSWVGPNGIEGVEGKYLRVDEWNGPWKP